jgi:large subunit ribosomal protein L10
VLKNSYVSLALANNDIDIPDGVELVGDTCVVFGSGDPAAAAKLIKDFGKVSEFIKFKGGVVDNTYITAKDALSVADLPPLPVMQAQLLGLLQAPARSLVTVLNAKTASIVYVIKAYMDKKQSSE